MIVLCYWSCFFKHQLPFQQNVPNMELFKQREGISKMLYICHCCKQLIQDTILFHSMWKYIHTHTADYEPLKSFSLLLKDGDQVKNIDLKATSAWLCQL